MATIVENIEESLESRLKVITSILNVGLLNGMEVINHELEDDRFVKNFIINNQSSLPESNFVLNRLKRADKPPVYQ